MQTIYLSVDAKRLTICREERVERASGGDSVLYYTRLPGRKRPDSCRGRILQLDDYRPLSAPAVPACAGEKEGAPARSRETARSGRSRGALVGLALDFCATAAVLALTVGALLCFFPG